MTRKYQMANKGAKRIRNWLSAPPAPGSAAKRNELAKMHSIKAEPINKGFYNMTPASEEPD